MPRSKSNYRYHTCQCGIYGICRDSSVKCNCDSGVPTQMVDRDKRLIISHLLFIYGRIKKWYALTCRFNGVGYKYSRRGMTRSLQSVVRMIAVGRGHSQPQQKEIDGGLSFLHGKSAVRKLRSMAINKRGTP